MIATINKTGSATILHVKPIDRLIRARRFEKRETAGVSDRGMSGMEVFVVWDGEEWSCSAVVEGLRARFGGPVRLWLRFCKVR